MSKPKLLTTTLIVDTYGAIAWFDAHPTVARTDGKVGRWCLRCTLTDGWNAFSCAPGGRQGGMIVHVLDPDTVEHQTREEADAAGAKYVNRESILAAAEHHRERKGQLVTVLADYANHSTYGPCTLCNTEALPLLLAHRPIPILDRGDDKLPTVPDKCDHGFRWCPTDTEGWPTVEQWPYTAKVLV